MLTEKEANKKICPLTFGGVSQDARCLASNCMMWRWIRKPNPNLDDKRSPLIHGTGYCGLAGKVNDD